MGLNLGISEMNLSAWIASLTPQESGILVGVCFFMAMLALYPAFCVLSLLWRVPGLVVARTGLAVAQMQQIERQNVLIEEQIRYYNIRAKIFKGVLEDSGP